MNMFVPDGVTICQNGGVFDELTHFHMHVIPRYNGQNFAEFFSVDGEINIEEKEIERLEETKRKIIDTIEARI
ncbi:hypothetical protein [Alkalihalobacterium alkalicellulosilyticum]|uniref:hypothetical protein n=1 Tax=Alkalihalobacterium alkalicellulosilyticum TaxID=1912214 RepID=UPI003AEF882B